MFKKNKKNCHYDGTIVSDVSRNLECSSVQDYDVASYNKLCSKENNSPRNDSEICSLAPRGRGLGRGGKSHPETLTRICNVHSGSRTNSALSQRERAKDEKNIVPVCLNASKKKLAFTLAEVLITLGIIGVVAAMTIPTLMTNIKAKKLRTQFLKSYSIVQQAFKLMENDDVSSDPTTYGYGQYYKTFLNYVNGGMDCGNTDQTSSSPMNSSVPCYQMYNGAKHYKSLDKKTTFRYQFLDDGQIALPDGTLLMFENYGHTANDILAVSVDINGYGNPPNVAGYDLFTFQLVDGELKIMGDKSTAYNELDKYCNPNVSNNMNGVACAQKAKENPDYFKEIVKEFK